LLRIIRCPKQEKGAGLFGYYEDFRVFQGRLIPFVNSAILNFQVEVPPFITATGSPIPENDNASTVVWERWRAHGFIKIE
jgi:hypothetical protein